MTHFPAPVATRATRLRLAARFLLLGQLTLVACGDEDPITDQANATIDKSPASWNEPGAKADPPLVRDAGGDGATESDGGALPCALTPLTNDGASCSFTLPSSSTAELEVLLDGTALDESASSGYQVVGSTLTLTGSACQTWSGSSGGDAGVAGDGGTHQLQVRDQACLGAD